MTKTEKQKSLPIYNSAGKEVDTVSLDQNFFTGNVLPFII